jgi:hypothetical protein
MNHEPRTTEHETTNHAAGVDHGSETMDHLEWPDGHGMGVGGPGTRNYCITRLQIRSDQIVVTLVHPLKVNTGVGSLGLVSQKDRDIPGELDKKGGVERCWRYY